MLDFNLNFIVDQVYSFDDEPRANDSNASNQIHRKNVRIIFWISRQFEQTKPDMLFIVAWFFEFNAFENITATFPTQN